MIGIHSTTSSIAIVTSIGIRFPKDCCNEANRLVSRPFAIHNLAGHHFSLLLPMMVSKGFRLCADGVDVSKDQGKRSAI